MWTQIQYYFSLLRFIKNKKMWRLSPRVLWQLNKLMRYEKLTKKEDKIFINRNVPPYPSLAFNRYLDSFLKITAGEFTLQNLIISLTNSCPYNCWHCYNKYNKKEKLSFTVIERTIRQAEKMGVFRVNFSGGEVLFRKDLTSLVKLASDKILISLNTTGFGLTENKAKELKQAGLQAAAVSLDHYKKDCVDAMRRYKGAFEVALRAIEKFKKVNVYTSVVVIPTKKMISSGDLEKYIDFVENLGVDEIAMCEPAPSGRLIDSNSDLLNAEEKEKLFSLHKSTNKNKKLKVKVFNFNYFEEKDKLGCGGGVSLLYVDAGGNVCPCVFSELSLGNVNNENLSDIYKRARKYFPNPRRSCLAYDYQKEILKNFDKEFPLSQEITHKILSKKSLNLPLPDIYKKIIKK